MLKLIIDNRPIEAEQGDTLLEAARAAGIYIPTFCYHEALEPYAACRLCMVELATPRGPKLVASCAQPCEAGMVVTTNSARVLASRRVTVELLMATGAHLPAVQALAKEMGIERPRYSLPADDCTLCGLCVRACDELAGARAISLVYRGLQKSVAPPFQITSSACIGCATCVLICPTRAIKLADITPFAESPHDARTCRLCGDHLQPGGFADLTALFGQEVPAL